MDPYSWSWNAEALVVLGLTAAYLLAIRRTHAPAWRIAASYQATFYRVAMDVSQQRNETLGGAKFVVKVTLLP